MSLSVRMYVHVYQVAFLLREHADGLYPLRRPHLPGLSGTGKSGAGAACSRAVPCEAVTSQTSGLKDCEEARGESLDNDILQHEFSVCIHGVRGLGVEHAKIWGEADCYVQYHFPTVTSYHHGNSHLEKNGEHV